MAKYHSYLNYTQFAAITYIEGSRLLSSGQAGNEQRGSLFCQDSLLFFQVIISKIVIESIPASAPEYIEVESRGQGLTLL